MNITLESDYAIRIVGTLCNSGKRLDAKTISEKTAVSLRYELARPSANITLKDVIEAIEGKLVVSKCLTESYECSRGMSGKCGYQKVFTEISLLVNEKLSEYTFDKFQ